MSSVTRETVLVRRPRLEVRLESDGTVFVDAVSGKLRLDGVALAVLDVFATARTLQEGLDAIAHRIIAPDRAAQALSALLSLVEAGVLRPEGGVAAEVVPGPGFDGAGLQSTMLADGARTSAWIEAVRRTVRPGDVVADLGTGTGILAVAAAQAGARRVFAIEATSMASVARAVAERNGVADRVEVVRGWSSEVDLPERVDVLVSELIGSDPLGERLLDVLADSRLRLARPGFRSVPRRLKVVAVPVSVPASRVARATCSPGMASGFRRRYGIDLSPLSDAAAGRPAVTYLRRAEALRARRLAEPRVVVDVDLEADVAPAVEATADFAAARPGLWNGVLLWFETELAPGLAFDHSPDRCSPWTSWRFPLWVFPEGRALQTGEAARVVYSCREGRSRLDPA